MPIRLFISFLGNDGSWTEPRDMTEVIGGEGNDSAPRLSPDGKYLFFQSVRKGGPPARGIYWVDARIIDRFRPRD